MMVSQYWLTCVSTAADVEAYPPAYCCHTGVSPPSSHWLYPHSILWGYKGGKKFSDTLRILLKLLSVNICPKTFFVLKYPVVSWMEQCTVQHVGKCWWPTELNVSLSCLLLMCLSAHQTLVKSYAVFKKVSTQCSLALASNIALLVSGNKTQSDLVAFCKSIKTNKNIQCNANGWTHLPLASLRLTIWEPTVFRRRAAAAPCPLTLCTNTQRSHH